MKLIWIAPAALALAVAGCEQAAQNVAPSGEGEGSEATGEGASSEAASGAFTTENAALEQITCDYPVKSGETADDLIARLGDDARRENVPGVEGESYSVIALWPDDDARRLEVHFLDEAMTKRSSVNVAKEESTWQIAGLSRGSALADVVKANGGGFAFFGFEWDFGGFVSDWQEGELDSLPGGCRLGGRIWLNPEDEMAQLPDDLIGDQMVRSNNSSLRGFRPTIGELWINYPE